MIFSYNMLLDRYSNYAAPKMKIKRMVEKGQLYLVRPGIYVDDREISKYALAHIIYGPSYISFETALSYHGIIPERAKNIISATTHKNRNKQFSNMFGDYYYKDVPQDVFPYGVAIEKDRQGNIYRMATPEKALLDTLYKINNVESIKKMKTLLFEDLRIEEESLMNMDIDFINEVGPLYKKKNIELFIRLVRKICTTNK
ncbi:MAG: hypothetical protein K5923_04600 [Clostridia bacterium]|nr:hypothetical protein [Clostridia bacterium]